MEVRLGSHVRRNVEGVTGGADLAGETKLVEKSSDGFNTLLPLLQDAGFAETDLPAGSWSVLPVPNSMAPALTDLMAGNVQIVIVSLPSVTAQMKSGRLRALGVTSAKRTTFMPELPTISESGVPGYEASLWWGIFAPAKTPKPVLDRLNAEIHRAMAASDMRGQRRRCRRVLRTGTVPVTGAF